MDCHGWALWKFIFISVVSFELTIRCTDDQPIMLDPALFYGISLILDFVDNHYSCLFACIAI